MDIKHLIAMFSADCDQRKRFIDAVPGVFDGYYVTTSGELVTEEELERLKTFKYFSDGIDFVAGEMARI